MKYIRIEYADGTVYWLNIEQIICVTQSKGEKILKVQMMNMQEYLIVNQNQIDAFIKAVLPKA